MVPPVGGGVVVCRLALQDAVVPPFEPTHDQFHGPEPVTLEAVPAEQRFVVGAVVRVVPLLVPHTPFTAVGADTANVAVTLRAALMVTVQLPVPLQAPPHPLKVLPVLGVAVRVTEVPLVYVSVQSVPHEMPVPEMVPFPVRETVSVYVVGVVVCAVGRLVHAGAVVAPYRGLLLTIHPGPVLPVYNCEPDS